MRFLKIVIVSIICSWAGEVYGQPPRVLTYEHFMEQVRETNAEYLAEKYNVSIAAAKVQAAKVMPDPTLTVGYANNQDWNLQMGYGVDASLDYTLELGGKRRARIAVAQSEQEMTEMLLENYFRNLMADATIAYLTALKQKAQLDIQLSSYSQMDQLAQADSIRFSLGEITQVDALQSRLEANTMHNSVLNSEGELRNALIDLALLQGDSTMLLPDSLTGRLTFPVHTFDPEQLIERAMQHRTDLQAALKSNELSQNNLRLARANRVIDLGLNIGAHHSSIVRNTIAPAPAFTGISAGISIPLKFSNTNKGEVRAAQFMMAQSQKRYEAVELQISAEVLQAYHKYVIALQKAQQFSVNMLKDAEMILQKKIYSYKRGETSILEVLNAQRTYNEVQTSFNEAQFDCSGALIELERSCGIWDIGF